MDTTAPPTSPTGVGGDPADAAELLNVVLRDEIGAEVAYRAVAENLARCPGGTDCRGLLRQLEEEHELAAAAVRDLIAETGGAPADADGALGPWSAAVHCAAEGGAAKVLRCLKDAEEQNLKAYEAGAASADAASAQLLRNLLIPAQQRHVQMLADLLQADDAK